MFLLNHARLSRRGREEMGNAQPTGQDRTLPSSQCYDPNEMEDNIEAEDDDNDLECEDDLNLGSAFRFDLLYQLASKVAHRELKVSMYEDCYNELLEGLERLENRTDSMTVGFSQFSDILSPKNLSNEELVEIFEKLDYEGRGAFEVVTVLKTIKTFKRISLGDDVCDVARRFDRCAWMPGFVDVYVDQKEDFRQHGMNLLQFLHRNRLPSSDLQCHMTNAYMKMMRLREEIVSDFLEKLTLNDVIKSNTQENGLKEISDMGGDCPLSDGKDDVSSEMSADQVIALWSVQLLTVTARASLPSNPLLLDMALQCSRNSIRLLQPLSLCHDSLQRPSFLTTDCLCELASFIDHFPDRAEVLELLLAFHLASGNLCEILRCLSEINASTKMVDCGQLRNKVSKVRQQLLRNESRVVKLSLCDSDCEKNEKNDPDSIAELHWNQSAFFTKTGQTKATFVFESSEWVEFSKIKIKVASGNCAPQFGFIIVLSEWPAAIDRTRVAEELEKFSLYDTWTKSDYDRMASAVSGQKNLVNIGPMAFFNTENRDEVDVEMKHSVFGKWLMVKFLNARDSEADHLEIVGVKCFGVERAESHALLERQVNEKIQNAGAVQSNHLTIHSVLSFLLHVLANEKQKIAKDDYYFCRAVQVYVDRRTGVVKSSGSDGWLVAKCPFTKEFSYFEIEIVESNKPGVIIGAVPACHPSGVVYGTKQIPFGFCTGYGRVYYNHEIVSQLPPSSKGDKIGLGFKYNGHMTKSVYFTKNGKEIYTQRIPATSDLYPALAFENSDIQVRLLDKRPWRYKDTSVLEKEKRRRTVAGRSEFINPRYIDLSKMTVDGVWELQKIFSDQLDQSFILQLLHSMLPWSIPDIVQLKNSSEIFDRLCRIVDLENESSDQSLVLAARDLIMSGIDLFYPLKDDRLKMLYELLNSPSTSASKSVIFQSLCHSFSSVDMDVILSLPSSPLQELDSSGFLSPVEKLLSLSFQESSSLLKPAGNDAQSGKVSRCGEQILGGRKKPDDQLHLTQLLNRLQLQLFGWIRLHLRNPAEAEEVEKHLLHYCSHLVVSKVEALLLKMNTLKDSDVEPVLLELETSALATTFPALALLLSQLSSDLSAKSKIKLLEVLKASLSAINRVLVKVPELASVDACDESKESEMELKCWEVESLHDVRNIEEVVKIFSFPDATIFEVEFDRKTGSQHSDDYLEFSDSKGNIEMCMGRFNRHSSSRSLKFGNSSYLRFMYRPEADSSSAYGYKFKVRAKKAVVKRFHWLYDLYLGLCRLFGRLSGSLLDKSPVFPKSATAEDKIEAEMYRSELWTTIFRGGLVIKKFERSLSGNYETEDQSDVAELVYQLADLGTEKAKVFLERCKDHKAQSHDIGGEEVDRAVRSVFSALLWHTQSLRHDVSIYLRNELDGKISSGIHEAYAAAEKLRLVLIAKRQSQRKEEEEMLLKDIEERKPVVDVVSLVEDKARFLLRFAGLSKVASKAEESKRRLESRISRHVSLSRCLSREPAVDLEIPVGTSKYPSFNLVFEFVQDAAWSCEKVEELLKRRCSHCEDLWKAYMLVCDCLRTVSDGHCNKLPCKIFLNELLSAQKKFGRHYADGLDGCGLALEANIRRSYYDLLRFMVSALRKEEDKFKQGGYNIFASYTLHLLDISWQAFDFPFLVELRLPELYFSLASVFSSAIEQKPPMYGVDETQEEYERNLAWAAKSSLDISDFHTENSESGSPEQMLKYIVAKFKKSSFRCDGCMKNLSVNYYRCLGCIDFDLCLECHENENIPTSRPSGPHSAEHQLILFKYLCIGCKGFITGTRWHCNVCSNFDLCNGCYKASRFPSESGHASDHGVASFPTPKVTQEYSKGIINKPLEFYTYQHSWMLFVALSYHTLDFLTCGSSEQKSDDSYLFAARQLLAMTYNLALDYLISCLDSDDVDSAIPDSSSTGGETELPKPEGNTHSSNSQEITRPLVTKTIGLITSLVSSRKKVPTMKDIMEVLTSEQFLFTLFDIARAERVIDLSTRLMSLGLLSRLLQQMDISSQASESLKSEDGEEMMIVDKKVLRMVQSLFDFGADCLEKRDLELAKAASEMLHALQRNQNWTKLLSHRCSEIVNFLDKEPSMSSIFALFAFTGFPEMLTVGTLVRISNTDGDITHGVVVCSKKDDKKPSVVELGSRQTIQVDEMLLDVVTSDVLHLTDNQISLFYGFITHAIGQIKNGVEYSTKSMWILALAIKAALNSVGFSGYKNNGKFYDRSFLGCMNNLASLGTCLPKALLLQDLEILSLEVNQSPKELSSPTVEVADPSDSSEESEEQEREPEGQPGFSLAMFMTEEQRMTYDRMVRASGGMVQNSSAAEKKKKVKEEPSVNKNQGIDKGLATMPSLSDVLSAEVDVGDCVEESNLQKPELISSVDEGAIVSQKKMSKILMKEQLKNVSDSDLPLKVARALAICYARHLLMTIISEWPEDGDQFTPQHIGCDNIADVFFVVNLLGSSSEAEASLAKIVKRLINYCQPTDVDAIARASGFFVGASEGQTVSIIRQIPSHPTGKVLGSGDGGAIVDGKASCRDEVYIPGATALNIRFEERFCIESDFELKFSSFSDLSENVQCFVNISSDDWNDFNINVEGDHVYCVLVMPEATSPCFKIKVTGILSLPDCFNIGYMALDTILDKSDVVSFLPLKCLWRQLVSVANSSSKVHRLKVIRLLLKILSLQTKCSGCGSLSVDLSYLRGLWKMYKKLTQDNENETIKPALVLALTELFFVAENLAQEWNIAENFALSMEDDTQSNTQVEKR